MRILDKYILRQYIWYYIIIFFSLSLLFVMVDVIDRLPRILRHSNDAVLISQYFALRVPQLFVLTSPVIVLIAGLFLMNGLSKYNESVAIRAAGISIFRMVLPLFFLALFISGIVLAFGEYVLPVAENRREDIYITQMRGQEREDIKLRSNIYYNDEKYIYYLGFFDGYQNRMRVIDITEKDENNQIIRKLQANEAVWENDRWTFVGTHDRYLRDGEVVAYYFTDSKVFPEITVTPQDFVKSAKKPMEMNYAELKEYISRLKKIGEKYHREEIDLYFKIAFPLANFIIILFCVPLATASVRSKGRGIIFLIGMLICFVYLVALRMCQSLGYNELLTTRTAVWLPHIVFFIIGVGFVVKAEV